MQAALYANHLFRHNIVRLDFIFQILVRPSNYSTANMHPFQFWGLKRSTLRLPEPLCFMVTQWSHDTCGVVAKILTVQQFVLSSWGKNTSSLNIRFSEGYYLNSKVNLFPYSHSVDISSACIQLAEFLRFQWILRWNKPTPGEANMKQTTTSQSVSPRFVVKVEASKSSVQ